MKRTAFPVVPMLLAAAMLLFACAQEKPGKAPGLKSDPIEPKPRKDVVETFLAGIEAYNSQDLAELIPLFPPDVQWTNMTAMRLELKGRPALARNLMQERTAFPDCKIGLRRILANGDKMVVQGAFRATHRGPILTIAATGRPVSYELVYFITAKDSLIQANVAHFNPVAALRQIGTVPVEAPKTATWPEKMDLVREGPNPEAEKVVDAFFAAWQRGEFDAIDGLATPSFAIENRAALERIADLGAIKQYLAAERDAFKGLAFEWAEKLSFGSFVAVRGIKRGTHTMQPLGFDKPLVKDAEISVAYVFQVDGGKIAAMEMYFDEFQIFKQFGISAKDAVPLLGGKVPVEPDTDTAAAGPATAVPAPVATPTPALAPTPTKPR